MHYPANAFAKDTDTPVIVPLRGKPAIGNRRNFSPVIIFFFSLNIGISLISNEIHEEKKPITKFFIGIAGPQPNKQTLLQIGQFNIGFALSQEIHNRLGFLQLNDVTCHLSSQIKYK